ncbi:MAG: AI-2E family transporter [Bacteroidia bacterium]|nr:AI-2E family transporter [Bacteroidia bacterium]
MMKDEKRPQLVGVDFSHLVDNLIKLLLLYFLLGYCGDILQPFLLILVWGGIIAIATHPIFLFLTKLFKGRSILSSILVTVMMLSIIVVPGWLVIDSLLEGINHLKTMYETQRLVIPPPSASTQHWPAFTKPLIDLWTEASVNTAEAIQNHSDQLKEVAIWTFGALSGFSKGLLQFIASVIIAGVYFIYSESIHNTSIGIFRKLAGERGDHLVEISITTIRNVVKGILGVAVIQAGMAGIGFFAAGVPFAGLWTILCLILAIVQIGAAPVAIPAIIYVISVNSTLSATLFTIWMLVVLFIDNVLKPILLGRGAPAPMLVIFLGAIGGFISHGFIGLFLGAVILTLAYKLFHTWFSEPKETEAVDTKLQTETEGETKT